MTAGDRDGASVRIPSPFVYLAAVIAGGLVDRYLFAFPLDLPRGLYLDSRHEDFEPTIERVAAAIARDDQRFGRYDSLSLSPDGRRAAVEVGLQRRREVADRVLDERKTIHFLTLAGESAFAAPVSPRRSGPRWC